jgi:hypothetical protein
VEDAWKAILRKLLMISIAILAKVAGLQKGSEYERRLKEFNEFEGIKNWLCLGGCY